MQLSVDLRFPFLPPIGLALRFLISHLYSSWPQNGNFELESLGLPMFLLTLLIIISVILLCLVVSVKFDLKVDRLRLRIGDVSGLLTILLLASLILPLSLFWFVYLMLLILSPFSGTVFQQLKRFVNWFCDTFGATVFCFVRNQEESEPPLPQVGIHELIDVEGSNDA